MGDSVADYRYGGCEEHCALDIESLAASHALFVAFAALVLRHRLAHDAHFVSEHSLPVYLFVLYRV